MGANVRRVRSRAGLTQAELAGMLSDAGRPIPVASIGRLESGKRVVDVDDLMAIALCLDVSPNALLLPEGAVDDVVDVTGLRASLGLLWEWALASDVGVSTDNTRSFQARSLPGWLDVSAELDVPEGREAILGVVREGDGWVERQVIRSGKGVVVRVTPAGGLVEGNGERQAEA